MMTIFNSYSVLILVAMVGLACSNKKESTEDALIGEWRNISIEVRMHTVNGADSSRVFEANEQNWIEKLGIKPIRTFYNRDGSYVSRYYTPDDSLVRESSGNWEVKNDSLYLYQSSPDSVTYISAFSVNNDTARFDMMLDWDQDGAEDDHYVGVQRRYSE